MKKAVNLRLEEDLIEAIKEQAQKEDRPITKIFERALKKYLEENNES